MMDEIRDEESVDALLRLASSGHRAISTLHTNSVCEVPMAEGNHCVAPRASLRVLSPHRSQRAEAYRASTSSLESLQKPLV
jgi:hypothetical protein